MACRKNNTVIDIETYASNSSETDTLDWDPQGGIDIYIDSNKDDRIYIYGHIPSSGYGEGGKSEEFITNEKIIGTINYIRSTGRITLGLVLEENFNGVVIDAEEKAFDNNKQQILGILKSIKIDIQ